MLQLTRNSLYRLEIFHVRKAQLMVPSYERRKLEVTGNAKVVNDR